MKRIFVALFAVFAAHQAQATSNVKSVLNLNEAVVAGDCNAKDAELLSDDVLRVLTPKVSNVASQSRQLDRHHCSVAVPFSLPSGNRLVVQGGSAHTSLSLRRASNSQTSVEVFTAGNQGIKAQSADIGPKNQLGKIKIGSMSSACGESGILRMNIAQVLTAKAQQSKARVVGAAIQLAVVRCN